MNRPIKFRVWSPIAKKMIYSDGYKTILTHLRLEYFFHMVSCLEEDGYKVKVQQFTGLTDHDKNDVYEDDILTSVVDSRLFAWLVVFENGCFGIKNIGVEKHLGDFFPINSKYFFTERRVITNVFENPEMLKP